MANSTVATRPAKPRPDFPLFPHRNGRWAKKVRAKFCYFGKWTEDPKGEAAAQLWADQKDDLLAGVEASLRSVYAAAEAMRRILVEVARRKRGPEAEGDFAEWNSLMWRKRRDLIWISLRSTTHSKSCKARILVLQNGSSCGFLPG